MRKLPILILLLACAGVRAAGNQQDYAYQAELGQADQPLQRIALPLDVLLAATRSSLADIAVFNREGKALPHAVTRAEGETLERERRLPVHEFSQFLSQRSKTVTTREQSSQAGSVSELETTETLAVETERKIYLIELAGEGTSPPLQRIELDWSHQPAEQLLQLKVEAGNDLNRMRTISKSVSLSNRSSEDPAWRTLRNIPRDTKYLRLTPAESTSRFVLHRATGFYREKLPDPVLSRRIATTPVVSDDGETYYHFAIPTRVSPRNVRIIPAESHSVIRGDLYTSREGFDQRFPLLRQFRQHNINGPEVKPEPPIEVRRGDYDEIWIRPYEPQSSPPQVELAYSEYQVVFLGDGLDPYYLAWGNLESANHADSLTPLLENGLDDARRRSTLVEMGPIEEAGGEQRLMPASVLPWKKWLLWGLLILAAALAARMAVGLYREMNQA